MATSEDDLRRVLLLAAFQMPSAATMKSRKSSITNAFVGAIIPVVPPSHDEIEEALRVLAMNPEDVQCAYCGDRSTEWDHLRPLVLNRRPTGYISEIANLVPACGKCNQSKGNKEWRKWMLSDARLSPTGRQKGDVLERYKRLEAYESWRSPIHVDFERIVGHEEWERYWSLLEDVIAELNECSIVAGDIRRRVLEVL
jgi:hypothetical protein